MTTSMNISLPESLKDYVKQRVVQRHYSNPSDYIRALIREDKIHAAEEELERLLLQGLESGEPVQLDDKFWKKKRARLIEQHQGKQTQ